jgi:hypothetical protein
MVYYVEVEVSPDLWLRLAVRDTERDALALAARLFSMTGRKGRVVYLLESY